MRLPPLRDSAFFTGLCISALLVAGAGASLAYLISLPAAGAELASLPLHPWWFSYRDARTADPAYPLLTLGVCLAIGILAAVSSLRARSFFPRASSGIALFFTVYLFSLCLECLRGPLALLIANHVSIPVAILGSRIVYGGRFAGELAIVIAGLRALELKYRRNSVLIGGLLLISFAIAATLPIDGTAFLSSLVFKLGDEQSAWFVEIALGVLGAASFAAAGFSRGMGRYQVLAASSVMLFMGRQIVSFSGTPALLAAGIAVQAAGIIVFLEMTGSLYGDSAAE
jgi:hypothetical protein